MKPALGGTWSGGIAHFCVQDLSLVGNLTKLVRMRAGGAPPSKEELHALFPHFLLAAWAILARMTYMGIRSPVKRNCAGGHV